MSGIIAVIKIAFESFPAEFEQDTVVNKVAGHNRTYLSVFDLITCKYNPEIAFLQEKSLSFGK